MSRACVLVRAWGKFFLHYFPFLLSFRPLGVSEQMLTSIFPLEWLLSGLPSKSYSCNIKI